MKFTTFTIERPDGLVFYKMILPEAHHGQFSLVVDGPVEFCRDGVSLMHCDGQDSMMHYMVMVMGGGGLAVSATVLEDGHARPAVRESDLVEMEEWAA